MFYYTKLNRFQKKGYTLTSVELIFVLILITISSFGKAHPKELLSCSAFRRGTFHIINKSINKKFVIERKNDFQIESTYDLVTNQKIKADRIYKISWKNDCEYVLKLDTSKSKYDETDLYINANGGLNCKIVSIKNKCCTIETKFAENTTVSQLCKIR
ncbi:hypothetical protein QE441_000828 [Chryseobacterium sp. SORGH_AS909]|uniref:Prepilin-type N-terminal cleavage/methylation domain-containing protein n=1 Tax=Chryseobacterium camelliae TaxID=1265445 RepID=A0ABU0TKU5_9FLAO|nr:hypothetical protein [Chryseobacterium camelliae]MDQ1101591.1 hypothetical protein [Chryseobacterium sp. SORGH_AS_1048]MDR6085034.1 hypothetical protein [Chryseobacterium sp. SORGH_AS_0909]MDR6129389.1 hypothetical protein [Chryseobacterium sp. SORGH_AS_1175]MDT3408482.1 hypothetical protein [Pseudacidovorax intermedius]